MLHVFFLVCVKSNLFSLQMAQGDIRSLYKRSLQHKVEYLHLKKTKTEGRNRAPTANEENCSRNRVAAKGTSE